VLFFFPGGRAMMATACRQDVLADELQVGMPPPNSRGNFSFRPELTFSNVSSNRVRVSLSIRRMA